MSDSDGKKTLGLRGTPRSGNVKQSFSHGRTKNVLVETKRKRVVVPKAGTPVQPGTNPAKTQSSNRPAGISDTEMARRLKAVQAAKAREAEDTATRAAEEENRQKERERRRAEQAEKEREQREAEEIARKKTEDIASLSFLGVGIQPPLADWGTMVKDLSQFINFAAFAPNVATAPLLAAGAIALLTVAVNFVVDWMLHKSSGLKD